MAWQDALAIHHRAAVEGLVSHVEEIGHYDAVIVVGSIARGTARSDSDLDVYLVVSADEHARRHERGDLAYYAECEYEGGYVDGKVISVEIMREAAEHGSEPMRASFVGGRVVHSTVGDLQPLVDRIGVYPEDRRAENMRDFFAMFCLHAWYFGTQALERDDPFLLTNALSNVTLFAGRLILAHNRVLYPCPKQMLTAVAGCAEVPSTFVDDTRTLLREPTTERLSAYMNLIAGFQDWGLPPDQVLTRFMDLDEWDWLRNPPPVTHR